MKTKYESPFAGRYASKDMQYLFSDEKKFTTWRKLWVALAEAEHELGLNITEAQIDDMKQFIHLINYETALEREKEVRHDVMSHVYAFGEQAKLAKPIIHLGATSCYVTDNTDIIIMNEALKLIKIKLLNVINNLSQFADKYKSLPTLGFTHFQPAQLTTVGKRACLWIQDLLSDIEDIDFRLSNMKLRGAKGTTGTQMSFLQLFGGDQEKVKILDCKVVEKMGFNKSYAVTGQTYPRKLDSQILSLLSQIAQTASKFSYDIRLLQNLKEIEEPFEKNQIGSSAMAYKRNPMRTERISSLARFVICSAQNTDFTAATQWLERTLDDSANRRITIPESFLAIDGILDVFINVTNGLVVYPKIIAQHVQNELPFMSTESILMECVKRGGDRQELHEQIRVHSIEAAKKVKEEALPNDLISRILSDKTFNISKEELMETIDPSKFIGRASQQTEEFLANNVAPILDKYRKNLGLKVQLNV